MLLALSLFLGMNGGENPHIPPFPQTELKQTVGTPVIFPKTDVAPNAKPHSPAPVTLSAQVLQNQTKQLFETLKGEWDNELQVFFEPELDTPKEKSHNRFHIVLSSIESKEFGDFALLIEYFEGSEHGNVLRSRIWGLSPDYQSGKINITQFEPKAGANYTTPKVSEFTALEGCNIVFEPNASGFTGAINAQTCKIQTKKGEILNLGETHSIAAKNWHISDIAKNEKGEKVFGNYDHGPNQYKKANIFTCWASGFDGKEYKTKSDFKIHDQGGHANVKLGTKNIRLRLRDVVWPLGNNRPSLTLYLLLGKDDYSDIYSWTDSDANRIALAFGDYQASCTRD